MLARRLSSWGPSTILKLLLLTGRPLYHHMKYCHFRYLLHRNLSFFQRPVQSVKKTWAWCRHDWTLHSFWLYILPLSLRSQHCTRRVENIIHALNVWCLVTWLSCAISVEWSKIEYKWRTTHIGRTLCCIAEFSGISIKFIHFVSYHFTGTGTIWSPKCHCRNVGLLLKIHHSNPPRCMI